MKNTKQPLCHWGRYVERVLTKMILVQMLSSVVRPHHQTTFWAEPWCRFVHFNLFPYPLFKAARLPHHFALFKMFERLSFAQELAEANNKLIKAKTTSVRRDASHVHTGKEQHIEKLQQKLSMVRDHRWFNTVFNNIYSTTKKLVVIIFLHFSHLFRKLKWTRNSGRRMSL